MITHRKRNSPRLRRIGGNLILRVAGVSQLRSIQLKATISRSTLHATAGGKFESCPRTPTGPPSSHYLAHGVVLPLQKVLLLHSRRTVGFQCSLCVKSYWEFICYHRFRVIHRFQGRGTPHLCQFRLVHVYRRRGKHLKLDRSRAYLPNEYELRTSK